MVDRRGSRRARRHLARRPRRAGRGGQRTGLVRLEPGRTRHRLGPAPGRRRPHRRSGLGRERLRRHHVTRAASKSVKSTQQCKDALVIDLRSDTVTQPTDAMWEAMRSAELGDAVLGDDPTVLALEAKAADLLGKEAGLFAPSGTQANLIGIMSHCGRGDEYIVGQAAHTYRFEQGGAAVLGSVQPQPIENESDGTLDLEKVAAAVKPVDPHFANTQLLCLENTMNGHMIGLDYLADARKVADDHGLSTHLDGARLFNAAVGLGVEARAIADHFDTISICLSKGLGTPIGSVLVGSAELMARGARHRKILGGGMRQAGILAAAGIHALDHHVDRLADDHANAKTLAARLGAIDGVAVLEDVQTNMVFIEVEPGHDSPIEDFMAARGIKILGRYGRPLRLVTHLDYSADDVDTTMAAFEAWAMSR
ncbi:MAG: low-specificity L-threonine aldolase [Actinomycetia bacterium]|nr:low-specificity L-threonine aldolase [Actinomycetes bacterium]